MDTEQLCCGRPARHERWEVDPYLITPPDQFWLCDDCAAEFDALVEERYQLEEAAREEADQDWE